MLQPNDPDSYYQSRELVPGDMLRDLERAKIVVTNYHAFKLRDRMELSKGGRSLLQGRGGEELKTLETDGQMIQRVMPGLMGLKNILVINDEAHHCYREKPDPDIKDWLDHCLVCKGGTYPAQLMYQDLADMACSRITDGITRSLEGKNPIVAVLDSYNPTGSTMHVNFNTSRTDRWETDARRCHINWVILDSDWEAEFCRVAESHPQVKAYVKNHSLGLEVPYNFGSLKRLYLPDFIVRVDDGHGEKDLLNLIVEIKGYRREDAKEKKSTMENYWIPGVNNNGQYGRWAFAELTEVYQIEADFKAKVEKEFDNMIGKFTTDKRG